MAQEIRDTLSQARGPQQIAAALDAIGNSGNSKFLTDLTPHLGSKEGLVRAHAVQAMGHMDPEATKDQFKSLITQEQDPQIRGTIAVTYAEQAKRANRPAPSEVVHAAVSQLAQESDPRVRGLLIELIGPASTSNPEAMQALAAQFNQETDPMLLKLIGKYVSADKLGS